MKREQFLITSTAGHNTVKYKWNSARKEVARLMQEYVNSEGEKYPQSHLQYDLIENKSEKGERGLHVSGVMSWEEKTTGDKISFFITKIA